MSTWLQRIAVACGLALFIYGIIVIEAGLELLLGITPLAETNNRGEALFTVVDVVVPPSRTVRIGGIIVIATSDRYLRVQSSDLQLELLIDNKTLSRVYYLGDAMSLKYTNTDYGYKFPGVICLDQSSLR